MGNYNLVLDINFCSCLRCKILLRKRMIVSYDNGIFWICLGLMMASASLLTLRRNDEGKEEKPKKCMSIHLIYSYVEIQFNCQYMNVCCYVPIFYDHTFSINLRYHFTHVLVFLEYQMILKNNIRKMWYIFLWSK